MPKQDKSTVATKETKLGGVLTAFNISPDGYFESFLLDRGGGEIVQVNIPDVEYDAFVERHRAGDRIEAVVEVYEDDRRSNHPVYSLAPKVRTWSSKVARTNFALHGEPNGFVLETGEFVHLKPPKAKHLGITGGESVVVTGTSCKSDAGHVVIEPVTINDGEVEARKAKKK